MCRSQIRRGDLVNLSVDEVEYNDDIEARRVVYDCYNKTRDDFTSSESYDNYLEEIEDMGNVCIKHKHT